MISFHAPEALEAHVGKLVGASPWHTVSQEQIDLFAEATGDHQWIHVDRERAAAGPFRSTIAHGFLTLSLLAPLMKSTYSIEGARLAVNYGLNRVRFITPVPAGARVRVHVTLAGVERIADAVQSTWGASVEVEGAPRPACVAETVTRHVF